ncbi:hypothetical protein ACRWQN_05210 [Shewanella sp. HL-SH8]|uniref:hypothetical protein n=1 Tax=Shewanella TaxID=22 RepID=UPI001CF89024|nr:hypothetical protein [Shewanella glacialimarina]
MSQAFLSKTRVLVIGSCLATGVVLSGCGFFGADEKQQAEALWLAKDEQLKSAIEAVRSEGIDAVIKSAETGSVSACVAAKLSQDPLGELVSVEGALAESAQVAELIGSVQKLLEQDVSFEQVASLLQKGADAASYAKALIEQQGVTGAIASMQQMAMASEQFATQDLGGHFQQLLLECQTK